MGKCRNYKSAFLSEISLFISGQDGRTSVRIYIQIFFITRPSYYRGTVFVDCASPIDNLVLVERKVTEGREEMRGERERERTVAISFHIYFRVISQAIISTFLIRETPRCLTDRSARRNISFTKVCAKRESSCLISSSEGRYFTHSKSFTFHVDLGMAIFAV